MIIPTILEPEFSEVKRKIELLEQYTPMFQIDIVDGKLTEGKTFLTPKLLDTIATETTFELDLMVENPQDYVQERIMSVFRVCANVKATDNIPEFIEKAKEQDYVVGISINLDTPIELIEPLLGEIDYVQFMDVVPGTQGKQKFNPKVIDKIKDFIKGYPDMVEIQVDGGLNEEILTKIKDIGIKNYVIGSAIFKSDNPVESYKKFKEIVHDNTNNLFSIAM